METAPKRLYRSENDRMIAGVAGGIAEYLAVDSTVIRLLFIILAVAGGSGVLIYFLCWLFIPSFSEIGGKKSVSMEENIEQAKDEVKTMWAENQSRTRMGTILIIVGVTILLANLGVFALHTVFKLWPLLLLFIGWQMLNNPRK